MKILHTLSLLLIFALNINAQDFSLESYIKDNDIDARKTADGIYYAVDHEGNGPLPTQKDYVKINYVGKLLNGEIFDSSKEGAPFVFQVGFRQVIQGWEKGIPLFKVGSKGRLYIPSKLGYGTYGAGESVPPNAALIYEIEVVEVMGQEAYYEYMDQEEERARQAFEQQKVQQFKTDKKLIQDYALDNKLKTKRLSSGMSYMITKKGKGATAKKGDLLAVHYTGFLLDGTKFDSSYDKKVPFEFVLGIGKVIDGWDEALQYFSEGAEGVLLIPSKLAYGPRPVELEKNTIPSNAVLVFEIKVESIEARGK